MLGEAISNAWDADANDVWVYIDKDKDDLVIGTVKTQINPSLLGGTVSLAILILLSAFFVSLIAALILSKLSTIAIISNLIDIRINSTFYILHHNITNIKRAVG